VDDSGDSTAEELVRPEPAAQLGAPLAGRHAAPSERRLLLVDPAMPTGECLLDLLAHTDGMAVERVGHVAAAVTAHPDVVLLNIGTARLNDPSVISQLDAIRDRFGAVPSAVLTERNDHRLATNGVTSTSCEYVTASRHDNIVMAALDRLLACRTFVPELAVRLTPREREVLQRLCEGKQNKVIAFELNIAESTTKEYVRQVLRKLGAKNRTHAAVLARAMGAVTTSHSRNAARRPFVTRHGDEARAHSSIKDLQDARARQRAGA
jgi:DNA-binding NarL/FixJ family response regulator